MMIAQCCILDDGVYGNQNGAKVGDVEILSKSIPSERLLIYCASRSPRPRRFAQGSVDALVSLILFECYFRMTNSSSK